MLELYKTSRKGKKGGEIEKTTVSAHRKVLIDIAYRFAPTKKYESSQFLIDEFPKIKQYLIDLVKKDGTDGWHQRANICKAIQVAISPRGTIHEGFVKTCASLMGQKPTEKLQHIEDVFLKYNAILHNSNDLYRASTADGKMTTVDVKNWIDWDDVLQVKDDYKQLLEDRGVNFSTITTRGGEYVEKSNFVFTKDDLMILRSYVYLMTLVEYPPQRRSGFASMIIITQPLYDQLLKPDLREHSYLVVKQNKFADGKMYSFGGDTFKNPIAEKDVLERKVPKETNSAYNLWFKYNTTKYLFPVYDKKTNTFKNEPITATNMGVMIKETFHRRFPNKNISANLLRKIFTTGTDEGYYTKLYKDVVEQKGDVNKNMNHSEQVSLEAYLKAHKDQQQKLDESFTAKEKELLEKLHAV